MNCSIFEGISDSIPLVNEFSTPCWINSLATKRAWLREAVPCFADAYHSFRPEPFRPGQEPTKRRRTVAGGWSLRTDRGTPSFSFSSVRIGVGCGREWRKAGGVSINKLFHLSWLWRRCGFR